jgi:nitrite reductase/ring-hydroxylating ferredoxin subunit
MRNRIEYPEKRRAFLRSLFAGLTAVWAGGMVWGLKNYFFFSPRSSERSIGTFSGYKIGDVIDKEALHVFVLRDASGLFAISDICSHRSCHLLVKTGRFECPCHNSTFDLHGTPIGGPAQKQLDYYYIYKNHENELIVDPARSVNSSFRYAE